MTAQHPKHHADARPIVVLFLVAMLVRAITFGNPVVHVDEQFYFATASDMWRGAWPYVDNWDRKPIGLFLVYLLPARLGLPWGIYAYQSLALIALVATAWLVMRMAQTAGWRDGALWAGLAYLIWPNLLEGQGGQSPIFYNLLVAGAALLLLRGDGGRLKTSAPAMLLIGLAMQIKYSVVFEGVFFGLWMMVSRWRLTRNVWSIILHGSILAMIALVPTVMALGAYALSGHLHEFWYANFLAILNRRANPLINQYADLAGMALILSPLVTLALITASAHLRRRPRSTLHIFLFCWLAASILGVLVFGTWFLHYGLPILVPATICTAGIFERSHTARRWAIMALVCATIGGQTLLIFKRMGRGGATQFYALAEVASQGRGCLYVYSGPSMLYAATEHCRATRFTFPSALTRDRDDGAIGVDQRDELKRVLAYRPGTIVVQPRFKGERAVIRSLLNDTIAKEYRLRGHVRLGREVMSVYAPR